MNVELNTYNYGKTDEEVFEALRDEMKREADGMEIIY